MKTKHLLIFLVCMLIGIQARAEKVEIDGLYYWLDSNTKTAWVVKDRDDGDAYVAIAGYKGDIVIPEMVEHNDIKYTVTGIGFYAFYCADMTSVTIPNSVTFIDRGAFLGCRMTFLVIPNSVTSIGWDPFSTSFIETIVSYMENPPTYPGGDIGWLRTTLYVPCGTKDKYLAAGWPVSDEEEAYNAYNLIEMCSDEIELEGELTVTSPYTYTGEAITPEWSFSVEAYNQLVEGEDYEVTYENNTLPGTATITVTGMGNYTGSLTGTFEIEKAEAAYEVNLPEAEIPYDGLPHGASVTTGEGVGAATVYYVASGQEECTTDEPVDVGTYSVYVEIAESDLCKGVERTEVGAFTINALALEGELTVASPYTYTGEAITPEWSFSVEAYNQLVEGEDYSVSIGNNTLPGTATITVTGVGNYTGSLTGTFGIEKAEAAYEVNLPEDEIPYDGLPHGASVTTGEGVGAATVYYVVSGQEECTTDEPVDVGTYSVYVEIAESDLYEGVERVKVGEFSICKNDEPEPAITLHVNEDNSETIGGNDGETVNVTIEGLTMSQRQWNTLCVPFDVTADQIADALGENADVEELARSAYDGETMMLTLYFTPKSEIVAGTPYVVKVDGDIVSPTFRGVTVSNVEPATITTTYTSMTGGYNPTVLAAGDRNTLFIANNHFYFPTTADALPATKCWLTLLDAARQDNEINGIKGLNFSFEDDDATGISGVQTAADDRGGEDAWYTLQGTRVAAPQRGVYIHNGKKVLVK